ncbi:MAG: hypothetical protein ACKODX_23650, partial [Gemmata sp.]
MHAPPLLRTALVALFATVAVRADEPREDTGPAVGEQVEFLRLSRDERRTPASLDTAIVEYGRPEGAADRDGAAATPLRV